MARPQFTKEEQELLAVIRKQNRSSVDILLKWAPWISISGAVFLYGFYRNLNECVFAGFIVTFGLLCRVIYYQVKDGARFKQIIDKYEESCGKSSD
jgi:hypothetical protein